MDSIKADAYRYAVKNAFEHNGKANPGAVIGKLKALHADAEIKDLAKTANAECAKVNALSSGELKTEFEKFNAQGFELKARQKEDGNLPDFDWATRGNFITRFAPNPSAVMHLGHVRAVLLSHEYAKKYEGQMILRFEDTDPKVKQPIENAEELYQTDLKWLGCAPDKTVYQSDRFERYYEVLRELMQKSAAYVCTCDNEQWKKDKAQGIACACRDKKPETNLADFEKMLSHAFKEGEAVVRIKTDMTHPDPSVRDWWAAKIVDTPKHPRRKNTWVWPGYNLAAGVDDHDMAISLILRGQEHAQNATKQQFMYKALGWTYPHFVHFGRMKTKGFLLSKSKINALVDAGDLSGFDDPRLGTLQALRRRGFSPNAIKRMVLELGLNTNDATLSIEKLFFFNQKEIEAQTTRLNFFESPEEIQIRGGPADAQKRVIADAKRIAQLQNEPKVRLRHLFNVRLVQKGHAAIAEYLDAEKASVPIVAWTERVRPVRILMDNNSERRGFADEKIAQIKEGNYASFDGLGICKIEKQTRDKTELVFTQP